MSDGMGAVIYQKGYDAGMKKLDEEILEEKKKLAIVIHFINIHEKDLIIKAVDDPDFCEKKYEELTTKSDYDA